MNKVLIILGMLTILACTPKKVAKDLSESNEVSIPFKLGKVVIEDKRESVVEPKISLSAMPSEDNIKDINPRLEDSFELEIESIVQRSFRGSNLTYDVVVIINSANKYMSKTWKETKEMSNVELVIELTNNDDNASFYQSKSTFSYQFDGPNVSDEHAQDLFKKTFKNALYLGLKKIQDEVKR